MDANCPACNVGTCDYEDERTKATCVCWACKARFTVEHDADFTGDHYQDTSTPGERIE